MASNSNSERTNVITMLCFKLKRFTQPCFLPFMAAEPRAHRCVQWGENSEETTTTTHYLESVHRLLVL